MDDHLDQLKKYATRSKTKEFIEGTIIWFEYFKEHKPFLRHYLEVTAPISFQKNY